ncbi:MAG: hypothetical protein K1X89_17740 [Myxococcaceae bacterium]|nr:hypothetical protein [Myxococcaceae bacterium]
MSAPEPSAAPRSASRILQIVILVAAALGVLFVVTEVVRVNVQAPPVPAPAVDTVAGQVAQLCEASARACPDARALAEALTAKDCPKAREAHGRLGAQVVSVHVDGLRRELEARCPP